MADSGMPLEAASVRCAAVELVVGGVRRSRHLHRNPSLETVITVSARASTSLVPPPRCGAGGCRGCELKMEESRGRQTQAAGYDCCRLGTDDKARQQPKPSPRSVTSLHEIQRQTYSRIASPSLTSSHERALLRRLWHHRSFHRRGPV